MVNIKKLLGVIAVSLGIIAFIFAVPYFINSVSSVNNKYVTVLLVDLEIAMTDDNCEFVCRFKCGGECETCSKCSKKQNLNKYLENIPQFKRENYYDIGFDYPRPSLIIQSILDLIGTVINVFFSVVYIIVFQLSTLYQKYSYTFPIITVITIFFCVFCCVYILFNKADKQKQEQEQERGREQENDHIDIENNEAHEHEHGYEQSKNINDHTNNVEIKNEFINKYQDDNTLLNKEQSVNDKYTKTYTASDLV